jgi:hypothetical protein
LLSVIALTASACGPLHAADVWTVRNNLDETFTVYVWPQENPDEVRSARIRPGARATIRLSADDHEVEAASAGGYVYVLDAMPLRDEGETNLKTIITPKEKRNGRTVYQYMNQEGFNESEASDLIRDVSRSRWTTTYATPNGGSVTTNLSFAGHAGSYANGQGKLEGITYRFRDGKLVIRGTWSFNNSEPRKFQFYVDESDPTRFSSNADGTDSSWGGSR